MVASTQLLIKAGLDKTDPGQLNTKPLSQTKAATIQYVRFTCRPSMSDVLMAQMLPVGSSVVVVLQHMCRVQRMNENIKVRKLCASSHRQAAEENVTGCPILSAAFSRKGWETTNLK
jgi:hypothetical protein